MTFVLAALLAAADVDGGTVTFVEAALVLPGDAGMPAGSVERFDPSALQSTATFGLVPDAGWQELGPSCVVSLDACLTKAQHVTNLEAQNVELKAAPPGLRPVITAAWVGWVAGILSAIAAGLFGCYLVTGSAICLRH